MWDDLGAPFPIFFTYSELIWRVQLVAEALSNLLSPTSSPHAPVAVYGSICPEILVAILGILSCPLRHQGDGVDVVEGVAYLPVDTSSGAEQWKRMMECGVELVVIEISFLEIFFTSYKTWESCHLVAIDTSLLDLGLIVAHISWREITNPHNVIVNKLPATIMTEYANVCDLACYACSNLCDLDSHGNKSDLINRTTGKDFSGHSEHLDLMNAIAGSGTSGQSVSVGCVSCNDYVDLVNRTPTSYFSRCNWTGQVPCGECLTKTTNSDFSGRGESKCVSCKKILDFRNRAATNSSGQVTIGTMSCKDCTLPVLPPNGIALILSTSGTTGDPVTVRIPHCSILPNILDLRSRFSITPDDVVFNASPLTFDPSVVEIFLALSSGSRLLMVPEATKCSPSDLASVLFRRQYVSVLQITPSLLFRFPVGVVSGQLLGCNSHVRVLALGGEQCPTAKQLAEWKHPQVSLAFVSLNLCHICRVFAEGAGV